VKLKAVVVHEDVFTLSCLPLTMELANITKKHLLPNLKGTPTSWPYEDRVLAWLEPVFADDIKKYHAKSVKRLDNMFMSHQVDHLDTTLLKKLVLVLERFSPGAM